MKLLEQLQQLMPLAAAATDGPWDYCPAGDYEGWSIIKKVGIEERHEMLPDFASVIDENDAAFIAVARALLTPENLTIIIGLLSNMESSLETNRVLAKRLVEIQGILNTELDDDGKVYYISKIVNPTHV